MTDKVTITLASPGPLIRFDHIALSNPLATDIRLPVTSFTGYQILPGVNVNIQDNIVHLVQFSKLH